MDAYQKADEFTVYITKAVFKDRLVYSGSKEIGR